MRGTLVAAAMLVAIAAALLIGALRTLGAPAALSEPAAMAVPGPTQAPPPPSPSPLPYRILDRGTCSRPGPWDTTYRTLPWVISDPYWYSAFWYGTHPRPRTALDAGAPRSAPPRIDFSKEMVVLLRGRPGSGEIRTVSLDVRGGEMLLTVTNPATPELAIPADRVPFEALVIPLTGLGIRAVETGVSQEFNRLQPLVPTMYRMAGGGRRPLREVSLREVRERIGREGRRLLQDVWQLQAATANGPLLPYVDLLEARIYERSLQDPGSAHRTYAQICERFPGTPVGRIARARLSFVRRTTVEAAARHELDRLQAERVRAGGPPSAEAWLTLGGQYEYLTTQYPDALFSALQCYRRGAVDPQDHDAAQNCLLRAGDICATYLDPPAAVRYYAECIRRYPDALSVPVVLRRMKAILSAAGDARAATVYTDFLRRFPRSPRVPEVRKLAGT